MVKDRFKGVHATRLEVGGQRMLLPFLTSFCIIFEIPFTLVIDVPIYGSPALLRSSFYCHQLPSAFDFTRMSALALIRFSPASLLPPGPGLPPPAPGFAPVHRGVDCLMYRDRLKGLYMVARSLFMLLLTCSAWPCLGPA